MVAERLMKAAIAAMMEGSYLQWQLGKKIGGLGWWPRPEDGDEQY